MKIFFEKTITPCVSNEVTRWHVAHGWVWNVRLDGQAVGVFFSTLLCGDGVILHFLTVDDVKIPAAAILAAFRKGVKIAAPLGVVFATVPADNVKLLRVVKKLGFVESDAGFICPERGEILLLKYLKRQNAIL